LSNGSKQLRALNAQEETYWSNVLRIGGFGGRTEVPSHPLPFVEAAGPHCSEDVAEETRTRERLQEYSKSLNAQEETYWSNVLRIGGFGGRTEAMTEVKENVAGRVPSHPLPFVEAAGPHCSEDVAEETRTRERLQEHSPVLI
jgi:hypothetical protein